ncbi:Repeat domain-containing protein [Austwickia chelonae]|uniref:N-acetylmuramoyl-L-alanine amidase n=1 Tax=Austwickia chelonae NBRC 105200 TaxID=1184607 RepID=K6ULQ5_9MICO|nr:FG-GAP-like repeat-containing protein [Austwickia chelonae]GAB77456.1 hypothetical protein AUCHE_05_03680 [Austwickia chelonae NBRC 105200]SEW10815.1 Repeat domain-containing protein [Austwickia chelonae]
MWLRRLTPLIGGVLCAPLFVVLPMELTVATPSPHPVQGAESESAMVDPAPAASPPRVSAQELNEARGQLSTDSAGAKDLPGTGVSVLKTTGPTTANPQLAAVAVTWERGSADRSVPQIRTKKSGSWGAWETMTVDDGTGPDANRSGPKAKSRQGSELYMVSGATEVQARIIGTPGKAPNDARLTVIDPGRSEADETVGTAQVGAANAVAPRPNIYTRAQWGADESWRTGTPENNNPRGIVIHHTADTNNYTAAMVPGMLRSMYRYATKTLGWDDIAYNFIIDRWGRIWQGRAWLYPEQPVFPAAHLSNNDRAVGVSMLGNYESEVLSSAARNSLVSLMAWKASLHGINPSGSLMMFNNKSGRNEWMPTINSHRDHYYTACPGANLYPLVPAIRREVIARVSASSGGGGGTGQPVKPATSVFRDFDGMSDSDILGRDAQSRLTLSSPNGKGDMTAMELIGGPGWGSFDMVSIVGDWDGDGALDVVARHPRTADLWLYPGNGQGGFLTPRVIGRGWNDMQTIVAPGDWDGDGKPDLIGTNRVNGNMYFYGGNGRGGFAKASVAIGHGWGGIKSFAGVGNWKGDGRPALAGVTFNGLGVLYYGSGKGTFAGQENQPGSWGSFSSLVGISNAYGDKKAGILGVAPDGKASFGTRSADGTVSWKGINRSYAGYHVYAG